MFLLGDFNVNLSHNNELSLDAEKFKNVFLTHYLFRLINKPTSEKNHTATVIQNSVCNVHSPLDISDVGILRPYNQHGIFCVMNFEKRK